MVRVYIKKIKHLYEKNTNTVLDKVLILNQREIENQAGKMEPDEKEHELNMQILTCEVEF